MKQIKHIVCVQTDAMYFMVVSMFTTTGGLYHFSKHPCCTKGRSVSPKKKFKDDICMYLGVVLPTIQERGEEGKARATHKTWVLLHQICIRLTKKIFSKAKTFDLCMCSVQKSSKLTKPWSLCNFGSGHCAKTARQFGRMLV